MLRCEEHANRIRNNAQSIAVMCNDIQWIKKAIAFIIIEIAAVSGATAAACNPDVVTAITETIMRIGGL